MGSRLPCASLISVFRLDHELNKGLHFWYLRADSRKLLEDLVSGDSRSEEETVGFLQRLQRFCPQAAPLEPYLVDRPDSHGVAFDQHEGGDILRDPGKAPHEGMLAHRDEVMDC